MIYETILFSFISFHLISFLKIDQAEVIINKSGEDIFSVSCVSYYCFLIKL